MTIFTQSSLPPSFTWSQTRIKFEGSPRISGFLSIFLHYFHLIKWCCWISSERTTREDQFSTTNLVRCAKALLGELGIMLLVIEKPRVLGLVPIYKVRVDCGLWSHFWHSNMTGRWSFPVRTSRLLLHWGLIAMPKLASGEDESMFLLDEVYCTLQRAGTGSSWVL